MPSSEKLSLTESQEDYLECIYTLVNDGGVARSRDISRKLGVNSSSVTGALRLLTAHELINYEPYGVITLTDTGEALAAEIAHRHKLLRDFFVEVLDIGEDEADSTACQMEHSGGGEVVRRLGLLMEYIKSTSDDDGGKWLSRFGEFRSKQQER